MTGLIFNLEENKNLLTESGESHLDTFKQYQLMLNTSKLLNCQSNIINHKHAFCIHNFFPRFLQQLNWNLYYSTLKHGTSYQTYTFFTFF